GVMSLEPGVPPTDQLLQETDGGARARLEWPAMGPGTDESLRRRLEIGQEPRHGVAIGIGPAADRIDRAFDRPVILADRAMAPIAVAPLMREPVGDPARRVPETLEPGLAPPFADDRRV